MGNGTLADKLRLKAGQRLAVINAPDDDAGILGELPEGVTVAKAPEAPLDAVLLFARTRRDLERSMAAVLAALEPGGLLWICYPKGSSGVETDLNRDILYALMRHDGWAGVGMVSIDDVWSAFRFKPAEKVQSRRAWSPVPEIRRK